MLALGPPSRPAFTAARTAQDRTRRLAVAFARNEMAANGLVCKISPWGDRAPTRTRPPVTLLRQTCVEHIEMAYAVQQRHHGHTRLDDRRHRPIAESWVVGPVQVSTTDRTAAVGAVEHRLNLLGDVALGTLDHQVVGVLAARRAHEEGDVGATLRRRPPI